MSVYARTGSPSRPGPYWVTAIKDGEPQSLTGKRISLGTYSKKRDAIAARKRAEREHNFHPNHGRAA